MPEMGGFEATAAIRALESERPRRAPADHRDDGARDERRSRALPRRGHGRIPHQAARLRDSCARWSSRCRRGRAVEPARTSSLTDAAGVGAGARRRRRELLAEISRLFVDDAPRHLEQIRAALDARDARVAAPRSAHGLKGAAANFDAEARGQRRARRSKTSAAPVICSAPSRRGTRLPSRCSGSSVHSSPCSLLNNVSPQLNCFSCPAFCRGTSRAVLPLASALTAEPWRRQIPCGTKMKSKARPIS